MNGTVRRWIRPSIPGIVGGLWGFGWCVLFARDSLFGGLENDEIADWPFQVYGALAFVYLAAMTISFVVFPGRAAVQALLGIAAFVAAASVGAGDVFWINASNRGVAGIGIAGHATGLALGHEKVEVGSSVCAGVPVVCALDPSLHMRDPKADCWWLATFAH
jgi:hypothetical protein